MTSRGFDSCDSTLLDVMLRIQPGFDVLPFITDGAVFTPAHSDRLDTGFLKPSSNRRAMGVQQDRQRFKTDGKPWHLSDCVFFIFHEPVEGNRVKYIGVFTGHCPNLGQQNPLFLMVVQFVA